MLLIVEEWCKGTCCMWIIQQLDLALGADSSVWSEMITARDETFSHQQSYSAAAVVVVAVVDVVGEKTTVVVVAAAAAVVVVGDCVTFAVAAGFATIVGAAGAWA